MWENLSSRLKRKSMRKREHLLQMELKILRGESSGICLNGLCNVKHSCLFLPLNWSIFLVGSQTCSLLQFAVVMQQSSPTSHMLTLSARGARVSNYADNRLNFSNFYQKISRLKFSLSYFDSACKMRSNGYKQAKYWSSGFKPLYFEKISSNSNFLKILQPVSKTTWVYIKRAIGINLSVKQRGHVICRVESHRLDGPWRGTWSLFFSGDVIWSCVWFGASF